MLKAVVIIELTVRFGMKRTMQYMLATVVNVEATAENSESASVSVECKLTQSLLMHEKG